MINFIKQKLIDRGYKKFLRKFFNPRKEFLEKSRDVFLNAVAERVKMTFLMKQTPHFSFYKSFIRYSVYAAAILIFSTGSLVAYADYKDVAPDSPLYNFKKTAEAVQTALATKNKKFQLYEKFAERRLKEIQKTQEIPVDHSQEKIMKIQELKKKLKDDFQKKIEAIEENESEKNNFEKREDASDSLMNLCKPRFNEISGNEGDFWQNSEKLAKFKQRCEKLKILKQKINNSNGLEKSGIESRVEKLKAKLPSLLPKRINSQISE